MLKLLHPANRIPERNYIFSVLLADWLGLEFVAEGGNVNCLQITCEGDRPERKLEINDAFFSMPAGNWLDQASLPIRIGRWSSPFRASIPLVVLYGEEVADNEYLAVSSDGARLGLDILGGAFFLLTRYEEIVSSQRDENGRFLGRFSILAESTLFERAIVNEYLELFWDLLRHLWPTLTRKPRAYRCLLSCDVDNVVVMGASFPRLCRTLAGQVLCHRPDRISPLNLWRGWVGVPGADSRDDFDFLMAGAERSGLTVTFNFIAGHGVLAKDGIYDVERRGIRRLIRRIAERGHCIGLHGSFESFRDPTKIQREFSKLRRVAAEEDVEQVEWGGRQHYLRWEVPVTWRAYASAGLSYDSSLGYADRVGFRAGTCYEFQVFDVERRMSLPLRERPLVAMDASLINPGYMGLAIPEATEKLRDISNTCRRFQGDFTFLWHNGQTGISEMRDYYKETLRIAAAG